MGIHIEIARKFNVTNGREMYAVKDVAQTTAIFTYSVKEKPEFTAEEAITSLVKYVLSEQIRREVELSENNR